MKMQSKLTQEHNRIHIYQADNEVKQYQKKEKMRGKKSTVFFILFMIWLVLLILSLFFLVTYNQWNFSLAWIIKYVSVNIQNFYALITGNGSVDGIDARLYQLLAVSLTGAALAVCGAIYQGAFKNIFAGPSSMGVMSGGSLGCAVYLCFFTNSIGNISVKASKQSIQEYMSQNVFERYTQEFFILAGCLFGVILVLGISKTAGKGKLSSPAMIVSGMVFATVTGNITSLIQYYMILKNPSDPRIEGLRNILLGNFDGLGNKEVLFMMGIPIVICIFILMCINRQLNIMALGEDEAATIGVNIRIYRYAVVALGTILTSVVIAFCGHVGFLGFMVPLIARKTVGPDMRKLLPASIMTGAIILLLIFDIAYFLGMTSSMNVVTSAVGCIVMIMVMIHKKEEKQIAT